MNGANGWTNNITYTVYVNFFSGSWFENKEEIDNAIEFFKDDFNERVPPEYRLLIDFHEINFDEIRKYLIEDHMEEEEEDSNL